VNLWLTRSEFLLSVEGVIAMQRAKGKPACLLIRTTSVVVIHLTHRNLLILRPHHNHSGHCTFRIQNKYNFQKVIRQCVRPLPEMNGHGLTPTFPFIAHHWLEFCDKFSLLSVNLPHNK